MARPRTVHPVLREEFAQPPDIGLEEFRIITLLTFYGQGCDDDVVVVAAPVGGVGLRRFPRPHGLPPFRHAGQQLADRFAVGLVHPRGQEIIRQPQELVGVRHKRPVVEGTIEKQLAACSGGHRAAKCHASLLVVIDQRGECRVEVRTIKRTVGRCLFDGFLQVERGIISQELLINPSFHRFRVVKLPATLADAVHGHFCVGDALDPRAEVWDVLR